MKKLLLLQLLLINSLLIFSQAPIIQWQKALGGTKEDYANSVQQTTDGGYIVAGYSKSNDGDVTGNHGSYDYWVIKLNALGSIQWQKSFGGTNDDIASSIQQTTDGGYIVAGKSSSNDGDVTGHHGNLGTYDCWIVKLDVSGTIQWQKSLGGTDGDWANSIQQTTDGGYIVAGHSGSYNGDVTGHHGNNDCWIVKLNTIGTIQWQKSLGGTQADYANSIEQTTDGGYIVAGRSSSNDGDVSGNHGYGDYWVVKLNATGTIQWQKSLGGTQYDVASSIQQTTDGGYIIAGSSISNDGNVIGNHGGEDYWIVKLSSTGTIQWQKSLGGTSWDEAYSIQQTTDGGYIVTGISCSIGGNYLVVKLDATGAIQWQKSLGGTNLDYAYSIHQTTDGGYIIAGASSSNDGDVTGNHGSNDCWIVKLSATITGVEENSIQNLISVYPNPSSGNIIIQASTAGRYSIINELGQTIQQFQLNNSNNYTINIENLSTGIYFVVGYNNNEMVRQKIIVTK